MNDPEVLLQNWAEHFEKIATSREDRVEDLKILCELTFEVESWLFGGKGPNPVWLLWSTDCMWKPRLGQ